MKRIRKNIIVSTLKVDNKRVTGALGQRGVCVAAIKRRNKGFIIGSFPVVKFTEPGRTSLLDPKVELWLPIAHDVAVSPGPFPAGRESVVEVKEDRHIRHINETIFRQSTTIAGLSEKLISSIANSR